MTTKEFEDYLRSIGGLIDGRRADKPLITSNICQCGEGWLELISNLIQELIDIGWNREVRQIKEKFAVLNFYTNEMPDAGFPILKKYIMLSNQTCEVCGSKDNVQVRGESWRKSLCDKHGK